MSILRRETYIPRDIPVNAIRMSPQEDMYLHAHEFWEIQVINSGSATHFTSHMSHIISKGDVFVIPPGLHHGYKNAQGMSLMNILYMPNELDYRRDRLRQLPGYHLLFEIEPRRIAHQDVSLHVHLTPKQLQNINDLAMHIHKEVANGEAGYRAQVSALFYQLQVMLSRIASNISANDDLPKMMGHLLSHLQTHYSEPLSMPHLADLANASQSTVTRFFRKHLNMSPMQYLIELRLNHVKDALRLSDASITQIGFDCGFEDSNYFSRLFKQRLGISPRTYRKIYREQKE